jgi:hypothetical protein
MVFSSRRPIISILPCVVLLTAIAATFVSFSSPAQEQPRWELFTKPPENVRMVWYLQARHVASKLELGREDARQLSRTYATARQEHLTKVEALPEGQESFRQFWQLREEASEALKKALVELLGEEKGKKAALHLGAFNFLSDNIAADLLAAQQEALAAVFDYQASVNEVMEKARESGSFEGTREKFSELTMALGKKASEIFSESQINKWKEKYGPIFERFTSN